MVRPVFGERVFLGLFKVGDDTLEGFVFADEFESSGRADALDRVDIVAA